MYKTACISFPRCGHHALKSVLSDYFGDKWHYCDNYIDPPAFRLGPSTETNFQKEHDLDLKVPLVPEFRYLVQVRNPVRAVQSWIDFDARVCAVNNNASREAWQKAFSNRLGFWVKWYEKWVLSNITCRLVVHYEDLIANPYAVCESVIQYMTDQHPNSDRLAAALAKHPLVSRAERPPRWVEKA